MKVTLRDNENFELAFRKFKRKVEDSNIMMELRDREVYEKPSDKRRKEVNSAKRRQERNRKRDLPVRMF